MLAEGDESLRAAREQRVHEREVLKATFAHQLVEALHQERLLVRLYQLLLQSTYQRLPTRAQERTPRYTKVKGSYKHRGSMVTVVIVAIGGGEPGSQWSKWAIANGGLEHRIDRLNIRTSKCAANI